MDLIDPAILTVRCPLPLHLGLEASKCAWVPPHTSNPAAAMASKKPSTRALRLCRLDSRADQDQQAALEKCANAPGKRITVKEITSQEDL